MQQLFVSPPSLRRLSSLRISTILLKRASHDDDPAMRNDWTWPKRIYEPACQLTEQLPLLAPVLRSYVAKTVRLLCDHYYDVLVYFDNYLNVRELCSLDCFVFSANVFGVVDWTKLGLLYVDEDSIPIDRRFDISCQLFLESDARRLWNLLSEEERRYWHPDTFSQPIDSLDQFRLYWVEIITTTQHSLSNIELFVTTFDRGNIASMKHIWNIMSQSERWEFLNTKLTDEILKLVFFFELRINIRDSIATVCLFVLNKLLEFGCYDGGFLANSTFFWCGLFNRPTLLSEEIETAFAHTLTILAKKNRDAVVCFKKELIGFDRQTLVDCGPMDEEQINTMLSIVDSVLFAYS